MQWKRSAGLLVICLIILAGVVFAFLALQGFETLKAALDAAMPDAEFETLTTENFVVIRLTFAGLAVFLLGTAYLLVFHSQVMAALPARLWRDTVSFVREHEKFRLDASVGLLLLIVLLAVLNRLVYVHRPMLHDESYALVVFAKTLRAAMTDYHLPNNHIFNTLLVMLSTRLFGIAPWAVRLPALAAGVLLVPAAYIYANQQYGKISALLAALLVAASPNLVDYATNARGYTLIALLTLALLSLAWIVTHRKNLFAWALIVVLSAIGFYSVPVMMFPFGMVFLWMLLVVVSGSPAGYGSLTKFLAYLTLSGLAVVVLVLALYLPVFIYSGIGAVFGNQFVAPIPWSAFLETLTTRLMETWREWTRGVSPVLVVPLVVGLVVSVLFHKRIARRSFPPQLAALAWLVVLLLWQRPNAWPKVWLFLLPVALVWSAGGLMVPLDRLALWRKPRLSAARLLFGASFVLAMAVGLVAFIHNPAPADTRGDAESAVLFLQDRLEASDLIVVAPPKDAAVWYYAELFQVDARHFDAAGEYQRMFVLVDLEENQTVSEVIELRGPADPLCAEQTYRQIEQIQRLAVFQCDVSK